MFNFSSGHKHESVESGLTRETSSGPSQPRRRLEGGKALTRLVAAGAGTGAALAALAVPAAAKGGPNP